MGLRPPQRRLTVGVRDGWWCHYCLLDLTPATATLDHVVPRAWGGTWTNRNLVLACLACNGARADRLVLCGCSRCVDVRLWWFAECAARPFRRRLVDEGLDLRAGEHLRGVPIAPAAAA